MATGDPYYCFNCKALSMSICTNCYPLALPEPRADKILDRIIALIDQKILKYDSDMEGAGWDDFIRAEWASGAMRQLKKEILKENK